MQSVDDPHVAFVVTDPRDVCADYQIELDVRDLPAIDPGPDDEIITTAIVTVPAGPAAPTVNLRAPVLINVTKRLGLQVILTQEKYPIRFPLEASAVEARSQETPEQDEATRGASAAPTTEVEVELHAAAIDPCSSSPAPTLTIIRQGA